jgi:predicted nuclease of predicted toxin-antitoxin system
VKLLFDQHLSPRLVALLGDLFPDSKHVEDVGLSRALDTPVWSHARDNGYLIVSKDGDFSDRSALMGFPPKIIWIRIGNCTTASIEAAIRSRYDQILAFNDDPELGVFTIFG